MDMSLLSQSSAKIFFSERSFRITQERTTTKTTKRDNHNEVGNNNGNNSDSKDCCNNCVFIIGYISILV
jgi:hypothetical protein